MNIEIIVLRLLHIVFGAFWVGSMLFIVLILEPKVRGLGPGFERKVFEAIGGRIAVVLTGSGVITIAAGTALALRLRWGRLDTFLNTGWGYAILIGFIAAILAFILGGVTGTMAGRIRQGYEQDSGDEAEYIENLENRMRMVNRLHALLVLIAVGSMASARFV